jgi:hypothetical protein
MKLRGSDRIELLLGPPSGLVSRTQFNNSVWLWLVVTTTKLAVRSVEHVHTIQVVINEHLLNKEENNF